MRIDSDMPIWYINTYGVPPVIAQKEIKNALHVWPLFTTEQEAKDHLRTVLTQALDALDDMP